MKIKALVVLYKSYISIMECERNIYVHALKIQKLRQKSKQKRSKRRDTYRLFKTNFRNGNV